MPCPECGGNNRSIGYENGDEISCKHCKVHLVLSNRSEAIKGNWSLASEEIES